MKKLKAASPILAIMAEGSKRKRGSKKSKKALALFRRKSKEIEGEFEDRIATAMEVYASH